ncbi:MAG: methyltransferase domain-containing protein [Acidimicrobiales bacterium]
MKITTVAYRATSSNKPAISTLYANHLGDISSEEIEPYIPSRWWLLRRLLPVRTVAPYDVFVDLGCGMGRIVLQAAWRYPFRRIIGVELDSELAGIARMNIAQNTARLKCKAVEIIHADARRYDFPSDATIVYLYNPFNGTIFRDVICNILSSLERNPRRLIVLYVRPVMDDLMVSAGFVKLRSSGRFPKDPPWAVYLAPCPSQRASGATA